MTGNDTPRIREPGPEIDVIIPLYRPGPWLEPCVDAVRRSVGVQPRIVLVDDTPADPDVAAYAASHDDVLLRVMPRNRGFAAGFNEGFAAGRASYVLLLNQDAQLDPTYLATLTARLEADVRLASVTGKLLHLVSPDGGTDDLIDSCGLEMRRGRRAVDIAQGESDQGQRDGFYEVFGVSGAAGLYRRRALDQVAVGHQVLDERFFMYKEDVDLAWRLRAAGWTAAVDTSAIALHARSSRRSAADDAPLRATVRAVIDQERAKSRRVRGLSWRNQLLLLAKNEDAADLARSWPDLVAMQLATAAIGIIVDPVGVVTSRLSVLADVLRTIRSRPAWRRRRTTAISDWLP